MLYGLNEDFDESLEEYDPDTWFFKGTEKADILATECVATLDAATMCFRRMEERAKNNLVLVIIAILSAPPT